MSRSVAVVILAARLGDADGVWVGEGDARGGGLALVGYVEHAVAGLRPARFRSVKAAAKLKSKRG
jgi:hypothetical protein